MLKQQLNKYAQDLKIIFVAGMYYLSALFGHFLAFSNTDILPTWPPSGVAFTLLILMGRKCWAGITIGTLIANIMAFWNAPELQAQSLIMTSSLIAISTVEALLGNYLIHHWVKDDFSFYKTKIHLSSYLLH